MLKIKDMNSNNVIRQGDSQPREYQLDTGNLNLNLANKQATIRLMTGDYKGIAYETTATVSSENKISFRIEDVIPAREYRLEITVDDYVFPSRATDGQFNVDPSSHGQEANIINVIGKEEIVRDVKARVENELEPFLGEIEQAELDRQAQEEAREETHEKVKDLPEAFQNVIDETTGKDVISAPEIIAARRGKASLGAKIDEVTTQLAQKAQQTALEVEKERINNLISLPEGSTTNDARLEDIRIGYDGTVYDSPGEAVRQQFITSMGIIIDNRLHRTHAVAVNISYDINQLDLSGAKIQVKFDTKIVGGVGSKFIIRHSDGNYQSIGEIGEYWSPVLESSSEGTSHVFTVDITDEIIQNSKFLTVTTNGAYGTTKVDLEITNIEIRTLGFRQENREGEVDGGVVVISSEQTKPLISETDEVLLEYDTGKVFFYDGTEWIEWGGFV